MKYVNHIQTPNSLILMFDGGFAPTTIYKSKNKELYNNVLSLIDEKRTDEIAELVSPKAAISKHSKGKIKVVNGQAVIGKDKVSGQLSNRLLAMSKAGLDYAPLINFWKNLKKNPSKQSISELYSFLEHNHVPITPDGCFIAYKSVTSEFTDYQTRTFDNTPGKTVSMPRNEVDSNRNITCSHGLHVAAFNYAWGFGSGSVILDVKVNPMDVVSVPADHNEQKIRVCKYKVLCVHGRKEEFKEEVKNIKTKKINSMKIGTTSPIRITKTMFNLIPKPKDDRKKTIYVCVNTTKSNCIIVTYNPIKKPIYIKEYQGTSSVYADKDAIKAANLTGKKLVAEKTKNGMKIREE